MENLNISFHKNITLQQAYCGAYFTIQIPNGEIVKVFLKPGTPDGHVLRLKRLGNVSDDGQNMGDAFIKLKIIDHPLYKLNGLDINAIYVITPAEALMGAVKKIPGPDGKILAFRIAPNSKTGDTVIIEDAGLKNGDKKGNIVFTLQIENLEHLNEFFKNSLLNSQETVFN
ncbi:MAG: hypothetical protein H6627_02395 [Calditrichae bacterium]|nr:hypothetical protein [Calditrichota bacterium]MCB9057385.1 hypothetical protein [Calditrichia bacterium]